MILGVLIGNLDLNLGYVAGFLILRKEIIITEFIQFGRVCSSYSQNCLS